MRRSMPYIERGDIEAVTQDREGLNGHVVFGGFVDVDDAVLEHVPHPLPAPPCFGLPLEVAAHLEKEQIKQLDGSYYIKAMIKEMECVMITYADQTTT